MFWIPKAVIGALMALIVAFVFVSALPTAEAARTGEVWQERAGTYLETIWNEGRNILINGSNKYLNFGTLSGSSGYGIRDNGGTIECKDSGGAWAACAGGGGGSGDITSVGDVTTGAAFDGTQGTTLTFNNAGGDKTLVFDGSNFTFNDDLVASSLTLTTDLTVANGGTGASTLTGILLGNGASAFTATTTSQGIRATLSDETGSGVLVFGTTPTFTTSALSPIWASTNADVADAGVVRLGNAEIIGWEASPTGTDVTLTVSSSEILTSSAQAEVPSLRVDSSTTGVLLDSDADGMFIVQGQGNGNDEDLRWNFDDAAGGANFVDVTSSTGVTTVNFSSIVLQESSSAVLSVGDLDTCAEFAALGAIETGTCGTLVFSDSPVLVTPTLGAALATTIDTGFGANELYDMDQHVLTTSNVTFADATTTNIAFTGEIRPDGLTCTNGQILKKTATNDWDCAADNSGGAPAWDTIADAAANGAIGMTEYTQTMDWDTGAVTSLAGDYLTLTTQNDAATDVSTQRLLVLENKAASTNAVEVMQRILNSDAVAVGTGLLIDGTAITTGIDLSDADIVTGIALGANDTTVGGSTISSTEFSYLDGVTSAIQTQIAALGVIAGQVWTGTHDFTAAVLRLPYGAAPTLSTNGDVGIDSTSNQFKYQSGGATKVLGDGNLYGSFPIYATSTSFVGTTTWALAPAGVGETWSDIRCKTDSGVVRVRVNDGTNFMNVNIASTTIGVTPLTSNNTFTEGENRLAQIAFVSGTVKWVACTPTRSITAD